MCMWTKKGNALRLCEFAMMMMKNKNASKIQKQQYVMYASVLCISSSSDQNICRLDCGVFFFNLKTKQKCTDFFEIFENPIQYSSISIVIEKVK